MASEPEAANEIVSTQSEKIESEEQLNFNKGQAIQDFIFKISEEFFNKSLTVSEFLKEYIIDKTLDGKEYQVVKRQQLLDAFKKERIDINYKDRLAIKELLIPLWKDYIDVTHIQKILSNLGIKEDIPVSTKFLNFDKLTVPSVRIFNRIINYMKKEHAMNSAKDFLKDKIQTKIIVARGKEFSVETIPAQLFEAVLRDLKLLRRHEEIPEEFNEFIELSPTNEDIILIKKLDNAITTIS